MKPPLAAASGNLQHNQNLADLNNQRRSKHRIANLRNEGYVSGLINFLNLVTLATREGLKHESKYDAARRLKSQEIDV